MFAWLILGCATGALETRVAALEQQVAEQDRRIEELKGRLVSKREAQEEEVVGKEALFSLTEWVQGSARFEDHEATLLVFFEEWCPHCKREVPALQAKADTFGPKGLGVVGITQLTRKTPLAKMEKFLASNNVKYPIAKDDGTMSKHYGVSGVPAAALVKDGKVIWRGHPAKLNDAMIDATVR